MTKLISLEELAELLRVTPRTIYRRLDAGRLPPSAPGTSRPRMWSEAVLERWLAGKEASRAAERQRPRRRRA